MLNALYVPKQYNTYADVFLMLGLAKIASAALSQTQQPAQIQLIDIGPNYKLKFNKTINLETIAKLNYSNPFTPVCGKNTDRKDIPAETPIFETVEHSDRRKLYRNYQYQTGSKKEWNEEVPKPPDPRTQNGVILTAMRHDRNHNGLWLKSWKLKDSYGGLIGAILEAFSQENTVTIETVTQQVANLFKQRAGGKFPSQDSAVKIYFPTSVQGVNRTKADKNTFDPQKADWLPLWLIACGLFEYGICERVKIADNVYDWRLVALEPKDISFQKYREILDTVRQYNPPGGGHGIARFDAELVLKFCKELLNNHEAQAKGQPENECDFFGPVNNFISGFSGSHFNSKGQVYGVKEIFKLGLPGWIQPDNYNELVDYLQVIEEHLSVLSSLSSEENHSELLSAYRDFITGPSLYNFFLFQRIYADYITKRLADSNKKPPRLFTVTGLNLMTKKEPNFSAITKDPSFLRIAKALNQATVHAGKIQTKEGSLELDWQRQYGLAQQLSTQAGSKSEFIRAITEFLGKYEAENLRLLEQYLKQKKQLKRIWPKKEDLDRLIELVEEFDTGLVANLLIAYGYAKWPKSEQKIPGDNTETEPKTAGDTELETADDDDEE